MAYSGPHIETGGLVFGYDTGVGIDYYKGSRFYKGRANTNYIAHQNAVAQSSYTPYLGPGNDATWIANHPKAIYAYNAQGSNITGYINTGVASGNWQPYRHGHWQLDPILNKPVVVMEDTDGQWKAKSFGTGMGSWNSYGKGYGDTYTISWLQWVDHLSKNAKAGLYSRNTSGSNGFHDGQANSATAYNTKLRTWQRVYQTYTTSTVRDLNSTYLSIYMYGHYNVRATVKIADVQFDWGDSPTEYQDSIPTSSVTSRSSTEGLIDLARNRDIDLANVSFSNTGQPIFDGTNDYVLVNLTGANLDSGCTIEGILKRNSTPGAWRTFFNIKPSGANTPFFEFRSNANAQHIYADYYNGTDYVTNAASLPTGTYGHAVATYDGAGNIKMYLDGELIHTKTGVPSFALGTSPRLTIGRAYSNDRYTDIQAPIVKVYNRALTGTEVFQHYLAYKNRFDL